MKACRRCHLEHIQTTKSVPVSVRQVLPEPRGSGKAQQLDVRHGQGLLSLLGLEQPPDGCHILPVHCQVICRQRAESQWSQDLST